ncbi:4-hydroxybenzoate polyprenyltransferase, mitochondrial-like isoform X2 [Paramacrobiotus metropolitanus]|uniref:4-hydroxybenzoate polyprenyltransferase, mitochondrial-like isoform X2 n=1 Tax=Paramacrobiotus metropolitanus TaxID=2943436 RepID=UPI0024459409|nr:4-hydroxybenzoate polyprenyltransferase, mitochondrial-like isoform X2 [Paramacrobiotus metropolitanus]
MHFSGSLRKIYLTASSPKIIHLLLDAAPKFTFPITPCGPKVLSLSHLTVRFHSTTGSGKHDEKQSGTTFLSARAIVENSPKDLQPYLRLIRADKPAGTWLLYWPCAWSIALAANPGGLPDVKMLTLFGLGAFLMRGAGCIINDMWDRDFDKKVARTRERPLASGEIQFLPALIWLGGQLGLSLAVLSQFNWFSIILGASSLGIVVTYPLFKRFTFYPQLALGLAFNWGALLGYAAVRGYIDPYSVVPLYLAGVCWTMVYDTIYAHQDKVDDALIGIRSTALKFGERTPLILWEFSAAMLFSLGVSGYMAGLAWPYFMGLVGAAGHLTYQSFGLKMDDPADCWEKFKSNHYLGALIFLSIVAGNLLRSQDSEKERQEWRKAVARNFPWRNSES